MSEIYYNKRAPKRYNIYQKLSARLLRMNPDLLFGTKVDKISSMLDGLSPEELMLFFENNKYILTHLPLNHQVWMQDAYKRGYEKIKKKDQKTKTFSYLFRNLIKRRRNVQ